MDALFNFLGSYWWLAFVLGGPIIGVIGQAAGWWSKETKQRHKRRLELIEAKSAARSRQVETRSQSQADNDADLPEGVAESDAASRHARLNRLAATHDEVVQRWLEYELDVAKLIAFPTMSDGREPLTAAFLRAKKVADDLRPAADAKSIDSATLAEYRDAVYDFESAFDVAEQEARRVRDRGFTEAERKRLDRAQQLLKTAVDQSATAAERQVAYKRVREELDGLIVLPGDAVTQLERKIAPQIEQRTPLRRPEAT